LLRYLHIRNIAVIEELEVEFNTCLNVITGETGSGKSIIIDSLELLTGSKASPELIRTGENQAGIEGLFEIPEKSPIWGMLEEQGIERNGAFADGVLIRRGLSLSGSSRSYVNGTMVPLAFLREMGQYLVEIHGQHDSRILLKPRYHLELLDAYHGQEQVLLELTELSGEISHCWDEMEQLNQDEHTRLQRLDLLNFQIDEIKSAELVPGEEGRLKEERDIQANAEKLFQVSTEGYEHLYEAEGSVINQLNRVVQSLSQISGLDKELARIETALKNVCYQLEDASYSIRDYGSRIEFSENRLNDIESRLAQLDRLKRKYGQSVDEVLQYYNQIVTERDAIATVDQRKEALKKKLDQLMKQYGKTARKLSELRDQAARDIEQEMRHHLQELGMGDAVFRVALSSIEDHEKYPASGWDQVEFLVTPNIGEDLRSLRKIASGGELSRMTLALKLILHTDPDLTMVFDEVDSGIGGGTAEIVGRKLRTVSRDNQTFCITHVPQIAALANHHFRVEKDVEGGKTFTRIQILTSEERVEELARMMGGVSVTDVSREHARQLIENI